MSSLTSTAQGSRVARHGSGRSDERPNRNTARRSDATWPSLTPATDIVTGATVSVPGVVWVRALPRRRVRFLPHHQLAAEVADLLAALVERLGLHRDDAAVGLGLRLHTVEHAGLGVDGVAVERGELVLQRLDLEIGDARTAHVGHAH